MDNITDYVRWYGSIDFEGRPFTRVDNIVLSQLSYLDLKDIPELYTDGGYMTLKDAVNFLTNQGISIRKMAPDDSIRFTNLVKAAAASKRFGNLYISSFVDVFDEEDSIQFAAMTFSSEPKGGWAFIGFRGTDSTIAGWKEDFMMSFMLTSSQKMAADYVRKSLNTFEVIMTGGHSKGGNLAIYSAAVLPDELFDRVEHIYTNDGPGFCPEVLKEDLIKRANPKTTRIIPQFSVVGNVFAPKVDDSYVIKSDKQGGDQHELCSWLIDHGDLMLAPEGMDPLAIKINSGFDKWIYSVDIEERKRFINALFDVGKSSWRCVRRRRRIQDSRSFSAGPSAPGRCRQEGSKIRHCKTVQKIRPCKRSCHDPWRTFYLPYSGIVFVPVCIDPFIRRNGNIHRALRKEDEEGQLELPAALSRCDGGIRAPCDDRHYVRKRRRAFCNGERHLRGTAFRMCL